ncbi:estrogen-related receptor gamma isoform X6 [Brachionus plicatilis]|uniref:Estrogen-related receptor gamma isoform X6 n=1 Tax=Brachionus plicatilis TaxID=10195 RepID=A0A3M7RFW2_BRAPC|nr:estrogen-related receptor gamma isoform X6 [Brachionus plicatilis]
MIFAIFKTKAATVAYEEDLSSHGPIPHLDETLDETPKIRKKKVINPQKGTSCALCGDYPNGIHYGITTCEACKCFFHRNYDKNFKWK